MWFKVAGILAGNALGLGMFYVADTALPHLPVSDETHLMQYSGVVHSHNMTDKVLRVTIPSSFSVSSVPGDMQFTYDKDTQWSSFDYIYEGDAMSRMVIGASEKERELPAGTLVTIQRDPREDMPFRASIIVFLKRTQQ